MGGTAGQRRAEKAERENAKAAAAASSKKKAEEDAYWAAAGDGAKSKAAARREAADAAADEAAAKRAEAKRLAKLEEEEMANMGKPKNAAPKKMTRAELEAYKNMSAKDRLKMKFAAQKAAARTVGFISPFFPAGETIIISSTPATNAGIAFIKTVLG